MKRLVLIVSTLMLAGNVASAQSFLERLGQKAKETAEQNIERKVEQKVNDALDGNLKEQEENETTEQETEEKTATGWTCPECGKEGNSGKFCEECGAKKPGQNAGWTCPECGKEGNSGKFCEECGAKKPGTETASKPATKKQTTMAYAKSDFVPGDEIFFDDPVEKEKVGEYPSHWDFVGGEECEIITLNGEQVIKISGWHTSITPLMKETNYLPEDFTIEFDVWSKDKNGDSGNNWIDLVMFDEDGGEAIVTGLNPDFNDADNSDHTGVGCSYQTPSGDIRQAEAKGQALVPLIQPDSWLHVSVSFNKRAYKYYVNGVRMINIPNAKRPVRFNLRAVSAEDNPNFYLKNIRVAKGAVPLYDRLTSEGKIVSYAITFETGKADLKPESMVEINRIAKLMNEKKDIKFEVQGHCDNTGSDKVNDPLSQKRAEAIVAALVNQGIDKGRLSAVGKGSHSPIADNNTDEGRAKNRRVEFVKK